jgi:tetratricopeptide (TPR) repeat protein
LIDARTDTHVWGDHYDRDLADVFAIESELAEQIVSKLKARLSPEEKNAIEEQPTRDLLAHDLYTRAKAIDQAVILDPQSDRNLADAAQFLEEAVARDPSFFDAHCLLASIYDQLYFFGVDRTPARLALAEATVQTVFRLRPEAGEAHLASARHFYWGYRDYDRARRELTIAARLSPNEPAVFELLGYIERRQGRWKESTRQLQRALELDPLNLSILQGICFTYERLRQFSEARAMLDRALRLAPKQIGLRVHRAAIDLWWRADSKPLDLALKTILREDPKAAESVADQRLYLALCERDRDEATKALISSSGHGYYDNGFLYPLAFYEGLVARLRNDEAVAHNAFTRSRAEVDRIVRQQPTSAENLSILGLIDAALGNKEEAIREGQRASELLPLETDSINGEILIENLAIIYAWTGETDLALGQLTIAAQVPGNLNYGFLRLHPFWDPLRGDPRFKEIVTSLAPGAKKS